MITSLKYHANFYVLTGGPGAGKTAVIGELEQRGYPCVPEVAREIIQEQMNSGGDALPWKNTERYKKLMLQRSVYTYYEAEKAGKHVLFFDRGIPDTLAYSRLIDMPVSPDLNEAAYRLRYNKTVFMLPPWKDIYRTDGERKQSWDEAVETFDVMVKVYEEYGYDVTEVPRLPVAERADFIIHSLRSAGGVIPER